MRSVRLLPFALVATAFLGCGGFVPDRPAKPVVADVTIHVPAMT